MTRRQQLMQSFEDKEYRDAFVAARARRGVAFQIRTMREERGWTQADLGARSGFRQEVISRFELGKTVISCSSLKRLAAAFDMALVVEFVPFSAWAEKLDGAP